jgi:hypothetical protein
VRVEDVVAVELTTTTGERHFVVTWGRVQGNVDPEPLVGIVAQHALKFGLHDVAAMRLCGTLSEARDAPYFYEALVDFAAKLAVRAASGTPHEDWRTTTDQQMRTGRELYYLGDPAKSHRRA